MGVKWEQKDYENVRAVVNNTLEFWATYKHTKTFSLRKCDDAHTWCASRRDAAGKVWEGLGGTPTQALMNMNSGDKYDGN